MSKLEEMIKRHEGLCLHVYPDIFGKFTIGIGHAITVEDGDLTVITEAQAEDILQADIQIAIASLKSHLSWFNALGEVRQAAFIDLCFQLGWSGLSKFKKTLANAAAENWDSTATNLLDSLYARQVPGRAHEIAEMLRTGKWKE